MLIMIRLVLLPLLLAALTLTGTVAQPKPDPKKAPQIIVMAPLGLTVGTTAKLTIRGLRLDTATAVRFKGVGVGIKIISKDMVGVPNTMDPNKLGDTQIDVEVSIPADFKGETTSCVVITPQGESPPHSLLVDAKPLLAEKEPNDSFRTAQPIAIGQVIEGRISQPMDVDVFRIDGNQGQQLIFEVFAARHGSALDSVLTLYNREGQVIASNDDIPGSTDSRIDVALPKTGVYYLSVIDAHDQGGPTHVYRLSVRVK
jgi:Bacterial pre-peptidase C-terminal domain